MSYIIENKTTGKFIKALRPRICEKCGHEHQHPSRNVWTDDLDNAQRFDNRQSASYVADRIFTRRGNKPQITITKI